MARGNFRVAPSLSPVIGGNFRCVGKSLLDRICEESEMPKLAGRGTLLAALAVPFVVVVAPLTATADTDPAGVVATEEGAAVLSTSSTAVQHEVGAWYDGTTNLVDSEEATETPSEEASLSPVKARPASIDHLAIKGDEEDDEDEDTDEESVEDNGVSFVVHDEFEAAAGDEGAWVETSESGAVESDGMSGGSAAWHHEAEAAAGEDGAYVESNSSAAGESDGYHDDYNGHHGEDDGYHGTGVTFAGYEETTAAAGEEGAFVESTSSVAVDAGGYGHHGDGATFAAYEEHAAAAGDDGAWTSSVESAAGEIDGHGYGHGHGHGGTFAGYSADVAAAGDDGAWTSSVDSAAGELD
ncbi:hypothetical protein [Actinophytocola gossypii]|uniref:Uncharacterized protein n=1 Tax=Actinophytocola gossypii TaxID=2812003 RepID=A0ABT2J4Y6_9PSEU|nr:hypothetical protein [Actinophytocola gossypii]MCT2582927.1 hypothetical protein [Actinophytocola gossypii]